MLKLPSNHATTITDRLFKDGFFIPTRDQNIGTEDDHHSVSIFKYSTMSNLKKGDMVRWNSSNGETHGKITAVHTKDFTFMDKQRHASEDEPQYEVMSEKTGKSAVHKASALKKM